MFDQYHKWLGIPAKDQPPNHYRLLGLDLFESDPDVIDAAANRQMAYIQGCATGSHIALSQKLLNEIAAARLCLLDTRRETLMMRLKAKQISRNPTRRPNENEARQPEAQVFRFDSPQNQTGDEQLDDRESRPQETVSDQTESTPIAHIGGGIIVIGLVALVVILTSGKGKESALPEKEITKAPSTVRRNNNLVPKKDIGLPSNAKTATVKEPSSPNDNPEKKSVEPIGPKLEPKSGSDNRADPVKDGRDLGTFLTPARLQKKFAGKAAFNPTTNELILFYDFLTTEQLKDFDIGKSKPTLSKGVLTLQAAETIKHVVLFKTATLTGVISCNKLDGDHILATNGVRVAGGGTLSCAMQGNAETDFDLVNTASPFELKISEKRVALGFGPKKAGVALKESLAAGNFQFGGGSGGNSFAKIVFQGQVDLQWAKEFFGK